MIGAAVLIASNIAFWGAANLLVPHLSWPTATLLSLPVVFILGQLAVGLDAWRSKADPVRAAARGALMATVLAVVLVVTQFFGTLYLQAADWLYVMAFGLAMVLSGAAMAAIGALLPAVLLDLVRPSMARGAVEGQGPADDGRPVPRPVSTPAPATSSRPASSSRATVSSRVAPSASSGTQRASHRSVWS